MNPKSNSITTETIIIGGGLHGLSTALHLAMRGMTVVVLEKDRVGRHASSANAGGVRRLGRALPEVPLSVASADIWQNMTDLVDDDCGFVSSFQVKLADTQTHMDQLRERAKQVRAIGFEHEEIIDQQTLRDLVPAVSKDCIGALAVTGDGYANPFQTVRAFYTKCIELGVVIHQGSGVENISRVADDWSVRTAHHTITARNIVNCSGAWGGKIAAMLGDHLPIDARAPMLMITEKMPHFMDGVAGAQGIPLSFKQFPNGTVLIGGGNVGNAYLETNKTDLDYQGLALSAATARRYFPIMENAKIVRCWAGIEGFMPDNIPVIGKGRQDNVFHSFGYSAHGYQMAPICGKILSELIIDQGATLPIDAFDPARFRKNSRENGSESIAEFAS
ncbi:FAD-binding oxidoreductase [Octadecabacter sp. G9-8]|uniref:FAD-binding oxidoreductase n=1 Tax=Octadecabacter dasysiphoniae TaxID=2909341 RepID=A0ABS9CXX5_9RHOB|nr:FAD-binding oxidoreductase [Octadecabacter dasysiphoniae]MCF2871993.1 FAD-binding oxidoreductase [Octadecabacter dasysiphoniae]